MRLPLETVPNFSEGRDRSTIDAIAAALGARSRLLDVHSDEDHNRSVYTLVGTAEQLVESLLAGITVARHRIDVREHDGAHPFIGAADIVPLVPLRREDMPRARDAAMDVARRIGSELGLPVFLYGDEVGGGRARHEIRGRGGPPELQARIDAGEIAPDFGPLRLDASAGGVMVGARRPLIALNVELAGATLDDAKAIAAVVRERDGGFPGVRALGLDLPRAGKVQVSMNVEDWEAAALHEIVQRVVDEAFDRGVEVVGSELVGLMPAGAAAAAAGAALRIESFDATRVLELRLLES